MIIRKFKNKDSREVANLVGDVFSNFNNKEGSPEAILNYINIYKNDNLEKIKIIFSKSPIFFVAIEKNKIVGMIRGSNNRIYNLFVSGAYHKKNIGKRLLYKFEKEILKNKTKVIKIRSSQFALNFYKKMGYKKTTGMRLFKGINIYPMKKML
jgi:GNAT superfamily N-acetyltransferase